MIDGGTDAPYERAAARGHVVRARVEDALAPAVALRLIVISENRLYREGLAHLLGAQPSLDVVGAAASAAELMLHDADVALVDVARPPGLRSVAELRRLRVDLPVIVVSVPELEGIVVQCAEVGVAGYVTTSGSTDELVAAARGVARGEVVCPPGVAAVLARRVAALANQRREPAGDAPPDAARARDPAPDRRRALQQGDRAAPLAADEDGQEPRLEHPRQARRRQPRGGRSGAAWVRGPLAPPLALGAWAQPGPRRKAHDTWAQAHEGPRDSTRFV